MNTDQAKSLIPGDRVKGCFGPFGDHELEATVRQVNVSYLGEMGCFLAWDDQEYPSVWPYGDSRWSKIEKLEKVE